MCGIVSHLVCVLAGAQGRGVAHASAPWGAGCLGAYCIASTNKIPTALPYFLAACFLTSGMTYLPNISIDDFTWSFRYGRSGPKNVFKDLAASSRASLLSGPQ